MCASPPCENVKGQDQMRVSPRVCCQSNGMTTFTCHPGAARGHHRIDDARQQRAVGASGILSRPVHAACSEFADQCCQTPA